MSHRRRIRIILGSQSSLTVLQDERIAGFEFVDPNNDEDAEVEEVSEAELTTGQVDCLENLATEFAD